MRPASWLCVLAGCGTASSSVTLATARFGASSVVIGDHVYLIGGAHEHERLASVERAAIHTDGSIDTFTEVADASLALPRVDHASAVVGKFVYVVGGIDGNSAISTVEVAPIAPDGSLETFATIASTASTPPRALTAIAVNASNVYLLGGEDGSKT